MPIKTIIFGVGGNCIDILDTLLTVNEAAGEEIYECVGFMDDDETTWGQSFHGIRVLGPLRQAAQNTDCFFINGIGSPANFWRKPDILNQTGLPIERFTTVIHPSASVSQWSKLGKGVAILQNVTVASNAIIGNHVIILPNSVISHDSVIGDYTCVAGGVCISGGVRIGQSCYLGTNSSFRGDLEVGDFSLIGMGSVVLNAVPENSVMVGNPARFLRNLISRQS